MSLTLNMVGGGGGGSLKDTDAVLVVTVPTGSTVTATKGVLSLTPTLWVKNADNTLDCAIFSVPASTFDANDWTVTATLLTDSASKTIVIDSAEEYSMEITYRAWLIKGGQIQTENLTAVGKKRSSSSTLNAVAPAVTYESQYVQIGSNSTSTGAGIAYFPNLIDVTAFTVLHYDGTVRNNSTSLNNANASGWTSIGTYQENNRLYDESLLSSTTSSYVDFSVDLDMTGISGYILIGFNTAKSGSNAYGSIRAVNVYLM